MNARLFTLLVGVALVLGSSGCQRKPELIGAVADGKTLSVVLRDTRNDKAVYSGFVERDGIWTPLFLVVEGELPASSAIHKEAVGALNRAKEIGVTLEWVELRFGPEGAKGSTLAIAGEDPSPLPQVENLLARGTKPWGK